MTEVFYPGFGDSDPTDIVGRQMQGTGAVIALEMRGGFEAAARMMENVRLFTPAVSLGSTDSLIEHPAGLTHRIVESGAREKEGITEGMIRIAVGIEYAEDLWQDLEQALDRLAVTLIRKTA